MRGNIVASTKFVGDSLEKRAALYYEALGYQVGRDTLIGGHQIDLIASRHIPGFGDLRIAVECKARQHSVGVNEITKFIETARHLINTSDVTNAVILTDTDFTAKAKLAVPAGSMVKLLRIDDLETDLFNNAESLLRVTRDYEKAEIFKEYYPLEIVANGASHSDAVAYIEEWSAASSGLLVLVGDFGSGKSTVLERTFYNAAGARILDRSTHFPVFLRLRGLRQHSDLWQFIESSLRDNQYIIPPKAVFNSELQEGRVLVLLDGFDEIYSGATARDRGTYLEFLKPLLTSKSPVVLSSRPTFFDSFDELLRTARKLVDREPSIERMPNFGFDKVKIARALGAQVSRSLRSTDFASVAELKQLSTDKIYDAILRKEPVIARALGMTPKQFEKRVYDIYDLEDLMKRPLLLNMILSTIATGGIDISGRKSVGASSLYDYYTQKAAFRDRSRSLNDQFLTPELRLDACRSLARLMYRKGEILLSPIEVAEAVSDALETTKQGRKYLHTVSGLEGAITDIRTCSFLRFSEDGSLSFTHKSFYEFFIAQDIYLASLRGVTHFFGYPRDRINREILYFLASYARDLDDFGRFLKVRMKDKLTEENRSFLYSIAFASGELLEKCTLSLGTISGVEMAKAHITSADATFVKVDSSTMRRVECHRWTLRDVSLDGCQLSEVKFADSRLELTVHGTTFSDCEFSDCHVLVGGKGGTLDDTRFTGGELMLDSSLILNGCVVSNVRQVDIGASATLHGQDTRFMQSKIRTKAAGSWYSSPASFSFVGCQLLGLRFSGTHLFADHDTSSQRMIVISECRGIVYISYNKHMVDNGLLKILGATNPDLFVIDAGLVEKIQEFTAAYQAALKRKQAGQLARRQGTRAASDGEKRKPVTKDALAGPPKALVGVRNDLRNYLASSKLPISDLPALLRDFLAAVD